MKIFISARKYFLFFDLELFQYCIFLLVVLSLSNSIDWHKRFFLQGEAQSIQYTKDLLKKVLNIPSPYKNIKPAIRIQYSRALSSRLCLIFCMICVVFSQQEGNTAKQADERSIILAIIFLSLFTEEDTRGVGTYMNDK